MSEKAPFTSSELLCVMSGRLLRAGQSVFAGVGIPLLAVTLAQRLHGPGITILFEGGILGPFVVPGELPPSTNEQRCTRRANMLLGIQLGPQSLLSTFERLAVVVLEELHTYMLHQWVRYNTYQLFVLYYNQFFQKNLFLLIHKPLCTRPLY